MKLVLSFLCGVLVLHSCSATISETDAIAHLTSRLPGLAQDVQSGISKLSDILAGPDRSANSIVENFLSSVKERVYNASQPQGVAASLCDGVEEALEELAASAKHEARSCINVITSSLIATLKDLKSVQPLLTDLISNVDEFTSRVSSCDPFEDLHCVPQSSTPLLKKAAHLSQRSGKANNRIGVADADTINAKVSNCVSNAMSDLSSEVEAVLASGAKCVNN